MNIKHLLFLSLLCVSAQESAVAEDKPTLESGIYNLVTVEDPGDRDREKPNIPSPQLQTVNLTRDETRSLLTFTRHRSQNEICNIEVKLELLNGSAFFTYVDPEGRFPRRVYAGGLMFSERLSGSFYDLMQDGSIAAKGRFLLKKIK
jgi:hypothetical protein